MSLVLKARWGGGYNLTFIASDSKSSKVGFFLITLVGYNRYTGHWILRYKVHPDSQLLFLGWALGHRNSWYMWDKRICRSGMWIEPITCTFSWSSTEIDKTRIFTTSHLISASLTSANYWADKRVFSRAQPKKTERMSLLLKTEPCKNCIVPML